MDFKITLVSLDRIQTADLTFKITTQQDYSDLAQSIDAIGVLQPPVLLEKRRSYTVVCGFRRIAACETLNIAIVPARILRPPPPRIKCAQIAISDNSFQRPLNTVEQSRAFALIRRFAGSSSSLMEIAQSTGLPNSPTAMDRIMPVAGMPTTLQNAILDGSITLPIALQINQLPKADAMALCDLFREITTGLNIQRELLALIGEISRRDDLSIARLMKQEDIAAVMQKEDSPAPQKVLELRRLLKAKRYPELSRAEAAYNRTLKSLKLNPHVQLQPPRFFEGTSYRLNINIDSRRQLKSLQSEIEKLILHPSLLPK